MTRLALEHLPAGSFAVTDSPVLGGCFHKLYEFSSGGKPPHVPRVIAYNSSAAIPLCFEWILMEKMNGVGLWNGWPRMDASDRKRLTDEIAHFIKQLLGLRFSMLGNIYFADVWEKVGYPLPSS